MSGRRVMAEDCAPAASLDASLLARPRKPAPVVASPLGPPVIAASVRLPPELHLRLRLLAAHTRRSQRDLFRAAIMRYLDALAPCAPSDQAPAQDSAPKGTRDTVRSKIMLHFKAARAVARWTPNRSKPVRGVG